MVMRVLRSSVGGGLHSIAYGGSVRFRGRVPDAVRPWVPLSPGERVLTHGRTTGGWHAIATTHGLQRQSEHGEGLVTPYVDILSVRWVPDTATLELVEATADGSRRVGQLAFADPGLLPETVHERVQRSILASRRVRVHGARAVTVVARRSPAGEGDLAWQVSLDTGLDESDPAVTERVDAAWPSCASSWVLSGPARFGLPRQVR